MKRALKKNSGVYAYLDSIKILETGSDEAITEARKAYWRVYKANWKKSQRAVTRQFTIAFNVDEAKQVAQAAKKHGRSSTAFIKEACLAYICKTFIVPDRAALGTVRQFLSLNYCSLKKMFDENLLPFQVGRTILQQITELEQTVLQLMQSPKTLEQWIEETVKCNPEQKKILMEQLQNLSV